MIPCRWCESLNVEPPRPATRVVGMCDGPPPLCAEHEARWAHPRAPWGSYPGFFWLGMLWIALHPVAHYIDHVDRVAEIERRRERGEHVD